MLHDQSNTMFSPFHCATKTGWVWETQHLALSNRRKRRRRRDVTNRLVAFYLKTRVWVFGKAMLVCINQSNTWGLKWDMFRGQGCKLIRKCLLRSSLKLEVRHFLIDFLFIQTYFCWKWSCPSADRMQVKQTFLIGCPSLTWNSQLTRLIGRHWWGCHHVEQILGSVKLVRQNPKKLWLTDGPFYCNNIPSTDCSNALLAACRFVSGKRKSCGCCDNVVTVFPSIDRWAYVVHIIRHSKR